MESHSHQVHPRIGDLIICVDQGMFREPTRIFEINAALNQGANLYRLLKDPIVVERFESAGFKPIVSTVRDSKSRSRTAIHFEQLK